MAAKAHVPKPRQKLTDTDRQPPTTVHKRPNPPKLGDRIESALTAIGITQERWKATKEAIGLPPTCGCNERKEWINSADQWATELANHLGQAAVDAISSFWRPIRPKAQSRNDPDKPAK